MKMKNFLLAISMVASLLLVGCKDAGADKEIKVISPLEVHEAVYDNGTHQLVDVRTAEEFEEGHLKNAQNISVTDADFEENMSKLDKDEPVYLYCRSGKRSAKAAQILKEMGFKEIYDMEGGYLKWQSEQIDSLTAE